MTRRIPFTSSMPPVASGWPPDQQSTPPCPTCGTPMQDVPQFRVNLVGPKQLREDIPPIEVADVIHLCPTCHQRHVRRFQKPSEK